MRRARYREQIAPRRRHIPEEECVLRVQVCRGRRRERGQRRAGGGREERWVGERRGRADCYRDGYGEGVSGAGGEEEEEERSDEACEAHGCGG